MGVLVALWPLPCRSGEIGRRKGLKMKSGGIAQAVDALGDPLFIPA